MYTVRFLKTQTGDASLIDYHVKDWLFSRTLIDCGLGPNYRKIFSDKRMYKETDIHLVLTHAHLDHWTGLKEFADVAEEPNGFAVSMSGSIFSDKLMHQQQPFEKAGIVVDTDSLIHRYTQWYQYEPYIGMPDMGHLYDLNEEQSSKRVVVSTANHRKLHKGCIVPVFWSRPFQIVFGADLEPGDWGRLYMQRHFPRNIDVLQAPGHGRQRMRKEILHYLNPRYVIISSSDEDDEESPQFYRNLGFQVYCLKDGDVTISIHGKTLRIRQ